MSSSTYSLRTLSHRNSLTVSDSDSGMATYDPGPSSSARRNGNGNGGKKKRLSDGGEDFGEDEALLGGENEREVDIQVSGF